MITPMRFFKVKLEQKQTLFWLLLVSLLLAGCSSNRPSLSPVSNQTHLAGEIPDSYIVRTGDSLYMIAMEFDLDYLDLARWNGISAPYTIHRGEKLRLKPGKRAATSQRAAGGYYTVQSGDSLSGIAEKLNLSMRDLAIWNGLKPPYTIHVGQRLRLTPTPATGRVATKKTPQSNRQGVAASKRVPASSRAKSSSQRAASGSMRWPSSGRISKRFSKKQGMTGVEFGGRQGDPVVAAGDGRVVYSGTGLVRYGKLLIVKHDNNLLSAYAHNHQLQVREGDLVKAGQQIATMGSSGTDRVKLHFEVRRNGKPVDPMRYLPRISK